MGNDTIPNRGNWFKGFYSKRILTDKERLIQSYIDYMFIRTQRMFIYENLPETIPQRELEKILQLYRFCIIAKDKKTAKIFCFYGGLGGQPNEYYQPTQAIVSNPYLRFFETLNLNDYINNDKYDAVLIWNDSAHIGLLPMFDRNASLLAECDLSLRVGLVNARIPALLKANTTDIKTSMDKMLEDIEDGKLAVIEADDGGLFDGQDNKLTEAFNSGRNAGTLKEVTETKQYILGSWYNELGLNANFNMKREAINESEADLNEDALLPLPDDMLECRNIGWEQANKLFGTNVKVKLNTSWRKVKEDVLNEKQEQEQTEEVNNEVEETVTEEKENV